VAETRQEGRRVLRRREYEFLRGELRYLQERGLVDEQQARAIADLYGPREPADFIKTVFAFGFLLVGLGVLTFVASNWALIPAGYKLLLITGLYGGSAGLGYWLDTRGNRYAFAVFYLALLVFGAGLFLVAQTFHTGTESLWTLFLLWSLGCLPLGLWLHSRVILGVAALLFNVAWLNYYAVDQALPAVLLAFPLLYLVLGRAREADFLRLAADVTTYVLILLFGFSWLQGQQRDWVVYLACVGFSLLLFYAGWVRGVARRSRLVLAVAGITVFSIAVSSSLPAGQYQLALTLLTMTLASLALLAISYYTSSVLAIVGICACIFRLYFDVFFDFLPKSVFFLVAGLILIAFGYWIAWRRRERP
jgi:uncharacterized membrane protein